MLLTRLISIALAAALPSLAAAQTPTRQSAPTATVQELTVTAPAKEAARLPELVSRFVQDHGQASRIDQLSRWAVPLCPKTGGLSAAFDAYVSARVLQVATAVGVKAARPRNRNLPCKPNLLVVFTTTPQKLLDDVRRRHPQMLGFHYAAQAERVATFDRAIQAWYMTGTGARGDNPEPDTEFGRMPGGTAGSRLSVKLTSQFMGVLVVVDSNQALGRQIGGIADEIAMLALARAKRSPGCSPLPSVLDFMNPDCKASDPPAEMTVYDVAYLKGLYSVDPEEFLAAQKSEIGSHMMRELAVPAPRPTKP